MTAKRNRRMGIERLEIRLTMDGAAAAGLSPAFDSTVHPPIDVPELAASAPENLGVEHSSTAEQRSGTGKTMAAEVIATQLGMESSRAASELSPGCRHQAGEGSETSHELTHTAQQKPASSHGLHTLGFHHMQTGESQQTVQTGHELGHSLGLRHDHGRVADEAGIEGLMAEDGQQAAIPLHKSTDVTLKRGVVDSSTEPSDVAVDESISSGPKRPNYFDGLFLRASDLQGEQSPAQGESPDANGAAVSTYAKAVDIVMAESY